MLFTIQLHPLTILYESIRIARTQVNYTGDREFYAQIPPSGWWTVDTFETHAWHVVSAAACGSTLPRRAACWLFFSVLAHGERCRGPPVGPCCRRWRCVRCLPARPMRADDVRDSVVCRCFQSAGGPCQREGMPEVVSPPRHVAPRAGCCAVRRSLMHAGGRCQRRGGARGNQSQGRDAGAHRPAAGAQQVRAAAAPFSGCWLRWAGGEQGSPEVGAAAEEKRGAARTCRVWQPASRRAASAAARAAAPCTAGCLPVEDQLPVQAAGSRRDRSVPAAGCSPTAEWTMGSQDSTAWAATKLNTSLPR